MRTPVTGWAGLCPRPRVIGPITQTDIVRFAGAGGDFNPLHHDPEHARAAGFDAPIAMGQLTAGLLVAWLTDWCGVEHLRDYQVRFTAPLAIGDTIKLGGHITAVEPGRACPGVARVELAATREGQTIVSGSATVAVTPAE